jgi:hypothetical protein
MSDLSEGTSRKPEDERTIAFDFTTGTHTTLNVSGLFGEPGHTDAILELFQRMAGVVLSVDQFAKAQETGLAAAQQKKLSLADLVSVWDAVPQLRGFARALLDNAMPGPHPEFSSRRDH